MIETIGSLKDNRMKTGAATSALASEHVTRMRKVLGSLNSRNLKAVEPLRVRLGDIRNSDKRGKWWLVGASVRDISHQGPANTGSTARSGEQDHEDENNDAYVDLEDLQRLAKEHQMNTEIRRAIFTCIMSATDALHARQRLLKLKLTRAQEQEIPLVLLRCAAAERQYNPYYELVARKLCADHKLRMAFQFALWDLFKRLGENGGDGDVEDEPELANGATELGTTALVNQARLYAGLVGADSLSIVVLKVDLESLL